MALENVPRADSPALSSGRDSPRPGRSLRRPLDDGTQLPENASQSPKLTPAAKDIRKQDKTSRRYASQVERALAAFDTGRLEWPDYISGLGRLLKALQSLPAGTESIPCGVAVASKLSQCLSPSLPSGVHSKALEVYTFMFSLIGKSALARDLPVFLPGLSSVLTFASLSIRPQYLALLKDHILPLEAAALRPALKALILSVLPGLEEETSEEFERTLKLLDNLKVAVNSASSAASPQSTGFGDEFFWQCLFLATLGGRSSRQGAYSYLVRRLPTLKVKSDGEEKTLSVAAESVISPEPGLLIRSFAAGLEDEQPLLQRGFLDLLTTHLPLDSPVLVDRVDAEDLQRLVLAAVNVVARRDMSLNRRLWSWFLGPQMQDKEEDLAMSPLSPTVAVASNKESTKSFAYFVKFGAEPLIKSIRSQFTASDASAAEKARPFRTCLSLMDRWEIGTVLVPEIFTVALEDLMSYKARASEAEFNEVLRSANGFFDAIESGIIWGQVASLITEPFSPGPPPAPSKLDLVIFIVKHFNVREDDMIAFHIPLCCLLTLKLVVEADSSPREVTSQAIVLADHFIALLPERAQLNSSFGDSSKTHVNGSSDDQTAQDKITTFYKQNRGDLSNHPPPFNSHDTAMMMLDCTAQVLFSGLHADTSTGQQELRARMLSTLAAKLPSCENLQRERLVNELSSVLDRPEASQLGFSTLLSMAQVLTNVVPKLPGHDESPSGLLDLTSLLVSKFWCFLAPSSPKYHVEAVRALWQLDALCPADSVLESTVSRFLAEATNQARTVENGDTEAARRFSVLWSHSLPFFGTSKRVNMWSHREGGYTSAYVTGVHGSKGDLALHRPLLLFLDALEEEETENHYFLVNWLGTMSNLYTIFDVLLSKISRLLKQRSPVATETGEEASWKLQNEDSTRECLYYLQHISNLLKLSGEHLWAVLSENSSLLEDSGEEAPFQIVILRLTVRLLETEFIASPFQRRRPSPALVCACLRILRQLLHNPDLKAVKAASVEEDLISFIEKVSYQSSLGASVQVALLDTTYAYLSLKYEAGTTRPRTHRKSSSLESFPAPSRMQQNGDSKELTRSRATSVQPPPKRLIKCLQDGIASPSSHYVLENWISFLIDVLPLYSESLFQNLIPLVETFCKQTSVNFSQLQRVFQAGSESPSAMSESSLISLLNGLEHLLALAHERLVAEEASSSASKPTEKNQSFFGTVVSGVFTNDGGKVGGSLANLRLTVILALQDAVRSCFDIWTWGVQGASSDQHDSSCTASYSYVASKLRNKVRRLLDRMFAVEPLECLETLIAQRNADDRKSLKVSDVNHLLHALDGSRPKRIMPSIFNSLYSRTNPGALEPQQMSSLSSEVRDVEISSFLIEYTKSLDDDAMDEIWEDCITFLRDVLSNPLVHSSILPSLLLFLVSLAEKIEHTNFGEQRKMRKDIGDIFLRLLTATFTAKPHQVLQELAEPPRSEMRPALHKRKDSMVEVATRRPSSIVEILIAVVPRLQLVLPENDKLLAASTIISTNVFSPVFHAKAFPDLLKSNILTLLQRMIKVSAASKVWRKDVSEIFSHSRLFSCRAAVVESSLLPILRQWSSTDKDRIPETASRLTAPTTAGIMFGVGASAARLDADKKTQLGLRRIALLILCMENDGAVPSLPGLEDKLAELMAATAASSPSSTTRAEIFMVLQAIVLKTASVHLASLWPTITSELSKAIGSALPGSKDYETYNVPSLLQACKLLDVLLLVGPDGFQAHEWIFITDTIDAVYRPPQWEPTGLVDEMAEELRADAVADESTSSSVRPDGFLSRASASRRKALLQVGGRVAEMSKEEFVQKTLQPFFTHLSIHSYEGTYSMREPDLGACRKALLEDLFDDSTVVG